MKTLFINQNTLEYDDGSWICILPNHRFYDNMEKSVACLELYDIVSNDDQIEQVEFDGLDNRDIVPAFHPTLAQYYGSFEMPWLIHKIKTLQNQRKNNLNSHSLIHSLILSQSRYVTDWTDGQQVTTWLHKTNFKSTTAPSHVYQQKFLFLWNLAESSLILVNIMSISTPISKYILGRKYINFKSQGCYFFS